MYLNSKVIAVRDRIYVKQFKPSLKAKFENVKEETYLMKNEKTKISPIEKIAKHNGVIGVLNMLQEESGEVIVAVSKFKRSIAGEYDFKEKSIDLAGEIADFLVVYEELLWLIPQFAAVVDTQKQIKVLRQLQRIEVGDNKNDGK